MAVVFCLRAVPLNFPIFFNWFSVEWFDLRPTHDGEGVAAIVSAGAFLNRLSSVSARHTCLSLGPNHWVRLLQDTRPWRLKVNLDV
jgi:hypothetical protein